MLYTRTGTPGAGKSYNMTQDIIGFLKRGHYVITNIPLVYGEVARLSKMSTSDLMQRLFILENEEITPSYLYTFFKLNVNKTTTELIIDEASDLFNSRSWNDKDRPNWLKFFRMHRHMYFNVCLISQVRKDLDKQIQGLFDIDYNYVKPSEFGVLGFTFYLLFRPFGKLGACRELYIPTRGTTSFRFFFFKKKYYKCYDSFTMDNYRNDFMIDEYYNQPEAREHFNFYYKNKDFKRLPGFNADEFLSYKNQFVNQ